MIDINNLLTSAVRDSDASRKRVERLTKLLADEMALLNGGDWRIDIDHDIGFALVRRCS